MKYAFIAFVIIFCYFLFPLQTKAQSFKDKQLGSKYLSDAELKDDMSNYDFSLLFKHTDDRDIVGFMGDNYQRIRIKFLSVVKSRPQPDNYLVYGKSMVMKSICAFHGTITITNIRKYKLMHYGLDDEYKNKGIKGQFAVFGYYVLSENKNQPHAGVFKGTFQSNFYLDQNDHIHYDDIKFNADAFTNNQFVGQWIAFRGNLIKRCNWGDFRVPNDGDLDVGAAEFSPNKKYLKNGWQPVRKKQLQSKNWWE